MVDVLSLNSKSSDDLEKCLLESIEALENKLREVVASPQPYSQWDKLAAHIRDQKHDILIAIEARDVALKVVKQFQKNAENDEMDRTGQNLDEVYYAGIKMKFSVSRRLCLAAYVSATWLLYDKLAEYIGYLAGPPRYFRNGSVPKFMQILCDSENGYALGFGLVDYVEQQYLDVIKFSNYIRNVLLHCGDLQIPIMRDDKKKNNSKPKEEHTKRIKLYLGDEPMNCFILNSGFIKSNLDFMKSIDDKISEDGRPSLLDFLENCHNKIDIMFTCLLRWGIGSFISQANILR